jgi:hypothetical protein
MHKPTVRFDYPYETRARTVDEIAEMNSPYPFNSHNRLYLDLDIQNNSPETIVREWESPGRSIRNPGCHKLMLSRSC